MTGAHQALSLLGLAHRARKIVSGEEPAIREIRRGRAKLLIVSTDASVNTKKRMKEKCEFYQVPLFVAFSRKELGKSIGKDNRVVIAVLDEGFAKKIAIHIRG